VRGAGATSGATDLSRSIDDATVTVRSCATRRAARPPGTTDRQDALVYVQRPRLTDPRRVIGAKPAAFSAWLFALLGMQPGDEFVDLYPGSHGVTRAWEAFNDASRRPGRRIEEIDSL
jgi:hypothetical protein